jgi:hypothetical protein
MPLCLILTSVFLTVTKRGYLAAGATIAMHMLLLGNAGPWGQAIKISGDLLEYVERRPDVQFATDAVTLRHLQVLNRGDRPRHVQLYGASVRRPEAETGPEIFLWNPLNLAQRPGELKSSPWAYTTRPSYRLLARLLPRDYVSAHPWWQRRPAGAAIEIASSSVRRRME